MFQVIVADPPWSFSDKLTMSATKRGADANYKGVLSLQDICDLPVYRLADYDALLHLWVPSSMLEDGIAVVKAWGFKVSGTTAWCKTTKDEKRLAFGMGHLFRQAHEITIEGRRGAIVKECKNKSQRSAYLAPNKRHSQKPENLQDSLDLMFPTGKKLELFARRVRPGWTCLGNEINGKDIRDELRGMLRA